MPIGQSTESLALRGMPRHSRAACGAQRRAGGGARNRLCGRATGRIPKGEQPRQNSTGNRHRWVPVAWQDELMPPGADVSANGGRRRNRWISVETSPQIAGCSKSVTRPSVEHGSWRILDAAWLALYPVKTAHSICPKTS